MNPIDAEMRLLAPALSRLAGIRHAFFTRRGGVSGGVYDSLNGGTGSHDAAADIAANRARMASALGVAPDRFLTAYQIHSPTVVVAETPWPGEARPRADAIVTRVKGLAVGVSTADCGPVLFADASAGVIGAAHAGWRGALAGVTDATIVAMERLGADRSRIVAALGPMIRQPNYEVGQDLIGAFLAADRFQRSLFPAVAESGPRDVRPRRLCRRPPHRRADHDGRGYRPVHLCRSRSLLQLSARNAPGRGGLRPPHQFHCPDLTVFCPETRPQISLRNLRKLDCFRAKPVPTFAERAPQG